MNFTKIIILFIFLITIFSIPVLAEPIYSNYSHYTLHNWLGTSGYAYGSQSMPTRLNFNFSMYEPVDSFNTISPTTRTDVSSSLNSSSTFNLTYTGLNVGSGSVHIYMDGSNYLHEDFVITNWNTSFIADNKLLVSLSFVFDDSSIFDDVPYYQLRGAGAYYEYVLTHGTNPNFYVASYTFRIRISAGDFWSWRGNQMGQYRTEADIAPYVPTDDSFIQFEDTPYNEYDNAIVNFSVQKIMEDYPDKRIYLEIATPKITEPYYNYAAFELNDYTGYRGLEITGKSPATSAYDNCSAYIRAYDMNMGNYSTLLEIETSVLTDNHTLLEYTGYDYPTNKSYVTGSYIGIDVDIMDYIETDFLLWPWEYFVLHVEASSNSNQGDRDYEYHIETKYWDADRYHVHHFSMQPYSSIDSDFNATIQTYITVYRDGNLTRLTPTINTSMWSSGYIPEGEEGYNPPDIPEEPEEPEIPDPEPEPEPEPNPPVPPTQPNGTGANQSINVSWTGEYYNTVNDTFISLCSPIYNFTNWSLSPVHSLNSSIGEFNYYMNESFTQTAQDSSILYDSINTIYGAIHPKIRDVITYYLIWVVLLIILKKD